jgi:hypothetical protein
VDAVTKAASDDSSFEERPTADPTLSDDSSYSDNEPARKKSAAAFPSESSDAGDGELDDTELETGDSPKPKPAKTARKSSSKLNSSKPKGRKGKGGFNIYNRPAPIAEFQAPNPISSPSGLDVMYDLEFTKNDNNSFRLNAVQDQVDGLRDELRNRHDTQSEQRDGFLTAIDVRQNRLEEFSQYTNGIYNAYSALKDENSRLQLDNSKLSNDLRAVKAELTLLKKSSGNETAALKSNNSATVASLKETIALLKEQKTELKKKISKLETNDNAVSELELLKAKKDLDVQTHLQKEKNKQKVKEQERENKKKEKTARFGLTSAMSNLAPSGTWNDIVVRIGYWILAVFAIILIAMFYDQAPSGENQWQRNNFGIAASSFGNNSVIAQLLGAQGGGSVGIGNGNANNLLTQLLGGRGGVTNDGGNIGNNNNVLAQLLTGGGGGAGAGIIAQLLGNAGNTIGSSASANSEEDDEMFTPNGPLAFNQNRDRLNRNDSGSETIRTNMTSVEDLTEGKTPE